MGQRVDAAPPQTQELPERRPGELQRGVTGARNEPGAAALARHLPSRAGGRPISLRRGVSLVRRGSAHRMMPLQFVLPVFTIQYLVTFRTAYIPMPSHVLHLPQVVLL
jgi:hypothetical protein